MRDFEYQMPEKLMKSLLKILRKDKRIKGDNQKILCDYVNNIFGLGGECKRVVGY